MVVEATLASSGSVQMIGALAKNILDLLAARHSKDVFVPECKDGPTQGAEHLRMDAWVMNRSWAHSRFTAYEIKTSRSDFLNDRKWRNYLPYCNEFYFVAPNGLIDAKELPPEAGLLEQLGGFEGKRLVCRKKAAWREVEIPESIYRYVLMCRTQVARSEYVVERTKEERMQKWSCFVAQKAEARELGNRVGEAIRETVDTVRTENEQLKTQMSSYDDVRSLLSRLDIDPNGYISTWSLQRTIEEQRKVFRPELLIAMHSLQNSLSRALEVAEEMEAERASTNGQAGSSSLSFRA